MRHNKRRYRLNRFTSWRKATLISMARNLLVYQQIRTTLDKAKATRPVIDKLICLAKENTLAAKRRAFQILGDHKLVSLLFSEVGPRFANRTSGFSRILALGSRRGDNAMVAIMELTEIKKKEVKKHKKAKEAEPKESVGPEIKTKEEKKPEAPVKPAPKEAPFTAKKPTKKFLGGLRNIFRKKSDSL